MPKYFFHQHCNGRLLVRDEEGMQLTCRAEAIERAVYLIPRLLAEQLPICSSTANAPGCRTIGTTRAHLSIEISDGVETLSFVRGKVFVEDLSSRR